MPATGAPSIGWEAYLTAARAFVEQKYAGRNAKIERLRAARWQENEINIPVAYQDKDPHKGKPYHSPRVRLTIRQGQGLIAKELPDPVRTPSKPDMDSKKLAVRIQSWLAAAYERMDEASDYWTKVTDAFVADSMAVWKCLTHTHRYTPERKTAEDGSEEPADEYNARVERNRQDHFPFVTEHVQSSTFYPLAWDDDGLSEVLELTKREALPMAEKYDLIPVNGKLAKNLGQVADQSYPATCEFEEYWNRTHYTYKVDGELVFEGEHTYQQPPYFYAFFSTTSDLRPEHESEGIAESVMDIAAEEELFVNIRRNWAKMSAFPMGRLRPVNEDAIPDLDANLVLKLEAGGTINAPPGYVWEFVVPPPIGEDITGMMEYLKQMGDSASLAPILFGEINAGTSGPAIAGAIDLAEAVMGPGARALARAFNEMAAMMLHCIDTEPAFADGVPIWSEAGGKHETIGPKEIQGQYRVTHKIGPVIALKQQQNAIMLADAWSRGAVDLPYYLEHGLGIADSTDMVQRVTIEQVRHRNEYWLMVLDIARRQLPALAAPTNPGQQATAPVGPAGGLPQVPGVQQNQMPGIAQQMPPANPVGQVSGNGAVPAGAGGGYGG